MKAVSPGTGTPTGSVFFYDGATKLGTGTLSGGKASISTSALSVATHNVTAAYQGSTSYTVSTSAAVSQVVK